MCRRRPRCSALSHLRPVTWHFALAIPASMLGANHDDIARGRFEVTVLEPGKLAGFLPVPFPFAFPGFSACLPPFPYAVVPGSAVFMGVLVSGVVLPALYGHSMDVLVSSLFRHLIFCRMLPPFMAVLVSAVPRFVLVSALVPSSFRLFFVRVPVSPVSPASWWSLFSTFMGVPVSFRRCFGRHRGGRAARVSRSSPKRRRYCAGVRFTLRRNRRLKKAASS